MGSDIERISDFGLDVLREVGNIGAGHAATALSTLLTREVQMNVPRVDIVAFDDVADIVGGPEAIIAGVFLRVTGDIPGSMFYLIGVDQAREIVRHLFQHSDATQGDELVSELALSALQELGNILVGSYLSALADMTHSALMPSPPGIAVDMAAAILSTGFLQLGQVGNVALVINTQFVHSSKEIAGAFFFIPDPGSVERLFQALGVSNVSW